MSWAKGCTRVVASVRWFSLPLDTLYRNEITHFSLIVIYKLRDLFPLLEWTMSRCLSREMQMMVKVETKLKRTGRTPVSTHSTEPTGPGGRGAVLEEF